MHYTSALPRIIVQREESFRVAHAPSNGNNNNNMDLAITILVGTMTGTSEMVAQEVQTALESAGYQVTIQVMDGLDAAVFAPGGTFLICTSTYGNGDVPDNAQGLFSSLETERPNLDNVIYGVIALGDTTYKDTFCQGGIRFDKLLTELGARRAGEMLMHDASSGVLPEETAAQWAVPWAEQYLAPLAEK
jgi:MioC protein